MLAGEDPGQPVPGAVPGGQPAARQPRVLAPQQQRVQLPLPAGQHPRQDRSVLPLGPRGDTGGEVLGRGIARKFIPMGF